MSAKFESDLMGTTYAGELDAFVFEASGPGPQYPPTNVIRLDQPWGVQISWTMKGHLTTWLNANFELRVLLDRMGPGADIALPGEIVNTLTGIVGVSGGLPTRDYKHAVKVAPGGVPEGVYKVVVAIHLFDNGSGDPTPIAGFLELGMVNIFKPKP